MNFILGQQVEATISNQNINNIQNTNTKSSFPSS